ncbi:PadR family transcriptional regulator [Plesiomonas shigelloides subsp. oncorhynchi]|nr:PadR family transcriptional regulator [Plesiomonas shigelloides]
MALSQVILTLLSRQDASGYDITKEFSRVVGLVWTASHQQVYRELSRLAEQGMVTSQLIPQEGKPDRKVYSITDSGRQCLQNWLSTAVEERPQRDELLVRMLACSHYPIAPVRQSLTQQTHQHNERLEKYQLLANEQFADPDSLSLEDKLTYLTLRRGMLQEQAWLMWAEEAQNLLAELELNATRARLEKELEESCY